MEIQELKQLWNMQEAEPVYERRNKTLGNLIKTAPMVIQEFNEKYGIKEVVRKVANVEYIGKREKYLKCPFCNGIANINVAQNKFFCGKCKTYLTPWYFVKEYYKLESFKDTLNKINEIFNENLGIVALKEAKVEYNEVYKIDCYLSEALKELKEELKYNHHILLNANTGIGKTFGINELFKVIPNNEDYIFVLEPTRVNAEQFAEDYPTFKLFYGNDTELPDSKHIVCTFQKIHLLLELIEAKEMQIVSDGGLGLTYTVVLDECHELMTKRVLLGEKARLIEYFLMNSDYSIIMSANTKYFYRAYKEGNLFKRYISIELKEKVYNAKVLSIIRTGGKEKFNDTINLIKDKAEKFDKVLVFEDNTEKLKKYSTALDGLGIDNIVISSKEKEDDESVKEVYNHIVKSSYLQKKVTFTTCLISCGVNIKNERVATIIIADRNQFDLEKIQQECARVRTFSNDITLLLQKPKEDMEIKESLPYENYIYATSREAMAVLDGFNLDASVMYKEDLTEKKLKSLWDNYRNNEAYTKNKGLIYADGNVLKLDEVAIFESARLRYERANYYNDKFIEEELGEVKVEYIEWSKPIEGDFKAEKTEKEKSTFPDDLKELLENKEAVEQFYLYTIEDMKLKEANLIRLFHKKHNQNKLYKEMVKFIKRYILPNKEDKRFTSKMKAETFIKIVSLYIGTLKKKERVEKAQNIYRATILNKLLPLGSSENEIYLTGDIVYYVVRKHYDKFIKGKHPLNEGTFRWALNELIKIRKLTFTEEEKEKLIFTDEQGKKTNDKILTEEIENCVKSIYKVTDKNYISKLN